MGQLHETWKAEKNKVRSSDKDWTKRAGMQADLGSQLDTLEREIKELSLSLKAQDERVKKFLELVKNVVGIEEAYGMGLTLAAGGLGLISQNDRSSLVKVLNVINSQFGQQVNQCHVWAKTMAANLLDAANIAKKPIG